MGREPRARVRQLTAADSGETATGRTFVASGLSTMVPNLQDELRKHQIGEEEIETCRPGELLNRLGIHKIDLLKIDVEGYEKNVLLGCGDKLQPEIIRYIFFECHVVNEFNSSGSGHTQLSDIDNVLTARGYRFITLYTEGIAIQESIGSYNALYRPVKLHLTKPGSPVIG